MTDAELKTVSRALQRAWDAYDEVERHRDKGRKDAAGFAYQGRLKHATDVLKEAEIKWERVRLEFLAEREEREAGPA
jgi:hypothetical protein